MYSHERSAPAALWPEAEAAFRRDEAAWAHLKTWPPGYRQRVLHVIVSAKKQETRDQRLARLIVACVAGRRIE